MSVQSAREFMARVAGDETFRQGLGGCKSRAEQHAFARAAGFDFTVEELKAASAEIQDSDLDTMSGGSCCGYTCEPENASPPPIHQGPCMPPALPTLPYYVG